MKKSFRAFESLLDEPFGLTLFYLLLLMALPVAAFVFVIIFSVLRFFGVL